jgi:hypothetical protein
LELSKNNTEAKSELEVQVVNRRANEQQVSRVAECGSITKATRSRNERGRRWGGQ